LTRACMMTCIRHIIALFFCACQVFSSKKTEVFPDTPRGLGLP
jgi:hypothetical protein